VTVGLGPCGRASLHAPYRMLSGANRGRESESALSGQALTPGRRGVGIHRGTARTPTSELSPSDGSGLPLVAWRHRL